VTAKLTTPQWGLLSRVQAGGIAVGLFDRLWDENSRHQVHRRSLDRLETLGLVRKVRGRPGDTTRTHRYVVTEAGAAALVSGELS
jgi:hypothetical protein